MIIVNGIYYIYIEVNIIDNDLFKCNANSDN